MRRTLKIAAIGAALTLAACGTSVKRVDTNEVVDVSGHWNDTDSRKVAEEMISDCLSDSWYATAQAALGKNPTVIVGSVHNESSEHIDTGTFIEQIQNALIKSHKVKFVASKGERGDVREERAEQDTHSSEETRKANGQEIGADFMLSGTVKSIVDQQGGKAVIYYQTNLKLLDMKTHEIAWNGQNRLKKLVSRSGTTY